MKRIILPSQKKVYDLGGGWHSKESADGARGLYHDSLFRPMRWWDYLLNKKGMATVYSDDWAKVRLARSVNPNVMGGSLRHIFWDFASLPAGNVADVLVCGKIYKGDRVLGGNEAHGALTSGGSTATGSYGTYAVLADGITLGAVSSAAKFLAATSMESAGNDALAPTIALGFGYVPTADLFLVCVNSVEAFATAGEITGYMMLART
jgi:hypothetical protein